MSDPLPLVDTAGRVYEPTTLRVQRSVSKQSAVSGEEVIEVHQFATTPAKVTVGINLTKNLGNYEAAKVMVSCTRPCYVGEEEDAYQEALRFAWEKAGSLIQEVPRLLG
jgi:hypothetical protein